MRLSVLALAEERPMWELAGPGGAVAAHCSCAEADGVLGTASGLVVVEADRVGFVSRRQLQQRSILGRTRSRTPVGRLADWSAPVLPSSVTLAAAVEAVLSRPEEHRYDDLLLRGPAGGAEAWRLLPAGAVLEALAVSMARRASRDELTGLLNRSAFFEHLHEVSLGLPGTGRRLAVVFFDLDRLKHVNDTLGHNVGDALLVSVARRLKAASHPGDLLARIGGDEFVVALTVPNGSDSDLHALLHRIAGRYLAVLRRPDPALDERARSSASLGAALSPRDAGPGGVETLLREADLAMYGAKQAGGDRVVVSSLPPLFDDPDPDRMPHSMHRALAQDELVLHYQPILDLGEGRISAVEALIRWQHPSDGLLGAERVLAAASADNALVEMDLWVLRRALGQLREWSDRLGERAPDWMNVNLSTVTLANPDLAAEVLRVIAECGVPTSRVRLELPETTTLDLAEGAPEQLTALLEAGVQLSLDDVGAGTSSLRHLATLPVAEMKIDHSFIGRMAVDDRARAVVEMLTNLARGLSITVTAEGVEAVDQLRQLMELGVDHVQGYFVAPPAPAAVVEAVLTAQQLGVGATLFPRTFFLPG
ncbi:putative bifunctional diguanylate cyclase/phosphodiesterase [Kineosporia succinea]|uniref:Diguanylate cyclase (GGDEF)-like protein n=1 Tax=Kineosporia succinea TaxID=84632 RepID=A0ABT9P223_9ACTN|nr:bifunctional diguanylate cyclase/phosphodiesterase [Kineosporia succinea]MDP9826729.1 diguanylate cyclase (GGDEF)-like protein [Kineosporia succinea]